MWTDQTRQECYALWNSGKYTLSQLAGIMGTSRNSIAGFIWRSKRRGAPVAETRIKLPAKKVSLPENPVLPLELSTDFDRPLRANLFELRRNECRFPFGVRDFAFCGRPTTVGQSWCLHHQMVVWIRRS